MSIHNGKDLGEALKNNQDTIEIEGNLKDKVLKIKATGKVAWVVAFGAIGIAVATMMIPEPTVSKAFMAGSAPVAVSVLGFGTTMTAISIAIAAGGMGALNKLRKYNIESNYGGKLILKRK